MPVGADPLANTWVVGTTGTNEGVVPGWTQGVREDLDNVIARIDPDETPGYTMSTKGSVSNIQFDWLVQELIDPNANNAEKEGFQFAASALQAPDRWHNICQILAKPWTVSDTMNAVDAAGRSRESAYQKILKALEIRRDLETIIMGDQVRNLTPEPRLMSAFGTWISNASVGGGAGVAATGDGSDKHTAGTARALTLDFIDDALEMAYEDGGKPTTMFMRPNVRRKFSKLPGVNNNETNLSSSGNQPAVTIGTVAIYLSDFGRLDVVMDLWMPNERVYLIDKRYFETVTLPGRSFKDTPIAKRGSSEEGLIEYEGSLKIRAPKAHAVVHDIDSTMDPV